MKKLVGVLAILAAIVGVCLFSYTYTKNDKTLVVLDRIMMTDGYHFMMAGTPLTTHRNKVVYCDKQKPNWLKKVKNKKKESM